MAKEEKPPQEVKPEEKKGKKQKGETNAVPPQTGTRGGERDERAEQTSNDNTGFIWS